jgi:hypothetical protein
MMDDSMDTVEPEEGDFFEGALLETCRDFRVTRPRVRPVGALPRLHQHANPQNFIFSFRQNSLKVR